MKHLKQQASAFFRTVAHSLSDIRFYRGARHKRPAEAAGYLAVLVSIFWLVPFLIAFFVGARAATRYAIEAIDRHVPAGTVFEVKNGTFTNTLAAPIMVPFEGARFIVNTSTSTATLGSDELGMAVLQTEIMQRSRPGRTETVSLKSMPNVRITKEQMSERIRASAPWVIGLAAIVLLCGFALASFAGVAALTLFYALLLWGLMRLLKRPMRYAEAWVLAAYAATAFVLATALMSLLGLDQGSLPTALYWVMLGFIGYDLWKGATPDGKTEASGKVGEHGAHDDIA